MTKDIKKQVKSVLMKIRRSREAPINYTTTNRKIIELNKSRKFKNNDLDLLVSLLDPIIRYCDKDEADYNVVNDAINMPRQIRFKKAKGIEREHSYYLVLFHELIHWSGHESRLDRKCLYKSLTDKKFEYYDAIEEITAELGANKLLERMNYSKGIHPSSLGYIRSFLYNLPVEQKHSALESAIIEADRAVEYIMKSAF